MPFSSTRNRGPDFSLCGTFTGKSGQSAVKWMKKLEWELQQHSDDGELISPSAYLKAVDLLLAEEAAMWAETTKCVAELIENPAPTKDTLAQFQALFAQRYPSKISEAPVVSFDTEVSELQQAQDKTLLAYYKRTASFLSRVGGRDRPRTTTVTPTPPALTSIEESMLDSVVRSFTRGIQDPDVCWEAFRGLVMSDHSLLGVYTVAEESRKAKAEYSKVQEEVARTQELQFLRDLVQRNMPTFQVDSLRAAYHVQMMPQWGYQNLPPPQPQTTWPVQVQTYQTPPASYPQQSPQQPMQNPHSNYPPAAPYRPPQGQTLNPVTMTRSANRFLNGSTTFTPGCGVLVCIRCGKEGHITRHCNGLALSRNEQNALKSLILGD